MRPVKAASTPTAIARRSSRNGSRATDRRRPSDGFVPISIAWVGVVSTPAYCQFLISIPCFCNDAGDAGHCRERLEDNRGRFEPSCGMSLA